jgi:hypothetical protein
MTKLADERALGGRIIILSDFDVNIYRMAQKVAARILKFVIVLNRFGVCFFVTEII